MKLSECYSVEDFIEWYNGASKAELKANIKRCDEHYTGSRAEKNERKAIETLLY